MRAFEARKKVEGAISKFEILKRIESRANDGKTDLDLFGVIPQYIIEELQDMGYSLLHYNNGLIRIKW